MAAQQFKTAPNAEDIARVLTLIRERQLRFADLWFTDLQGRPWRITMPANAVNEAFFLSGLPLDGLPVGGSWSGVMVLQPDPQAVFVDPTAAAPTLALICDPLDPITRRPLPLEPRHILRAAQKYVVDSGAAASMTLGAEPEFTLLDGAGRVAMESTVWNFMRKVAVALDSAGLTIDWFRTGPAIGQGRVQMRSHQPMTTADQVLIYRHVAEGIARRHDMVASFLAKPLADDRSIGLPVHQALWRGEENLFHSDNGWALTSDTCRWYTGGLLKHLPALLGLCAVTTNSYRRLVSGHAGPTEMMVSCDNKRAVCRIPTRNTDPKARRVKFNAADPMANPYLAFAALIMAGLDGIETRCNPPTDAGPGDGLDVWFPHSLEESLGALNRDRAFLLKGDVFSNVILDAWTKDRWESQILPVRAQPHPAELSLAHQTNSSVFSRSIDLD